MAHHLGAEASILDRLAISLDQLNALDADLREERQVSHNLGCEEFVVGMRRMIGDAQ